MKYGLIAGVVVMAFLAGFRVGHFIVFDVPLFIAKLHQYEWKRQVIRSLLLLTVLTACLVYEVSR